ncbi:MAG: hypothetical protein H0X62_05345 [Bacteroidetes bacterium]|nr:hypothetical protein [Bacteroidota bacterium]
MINTIKLKPIALSVCFILVFNINAGAQETEESLHENDIEIFDEYEDVDYSDEMEGYEEYSWLDERKEHLKQCEDLIIYGDKKQLNYFHIINEGKERFLYFDDVIISTEEGALTKIFYPHIYQDKNTNVNSTEIEINLSRSLKFKPQSKGFGKATFDCIEMFPNNLFTENAFSHSEIIRMDKDKSGKIVFVELTFSFVGKDDFDDEISITGYIKTDNIIDLSDKYKAIIKDTQGKILEEEVKYLFSDETKGAVTVLTFEQYRSASFSEILLTDNEIVSSDNEVGKKFTIGTFKPDFVQLNYYKGQVLGFSENRIFRFANYHHLKLHNMKLEKSASTKKPQKLRNLNIFEIPTYQRQGSPSLRGEQQILSIQNFPPTENILIKNISGQKYDYCPSQLEEICITEIIKNEKAISEISINAEYREIWTALDDFFDEITIIQLNIPVKYQKFITNNEEEKAKKALINDFDELLKKYKVPFDKKGEFYQQLRSAGGRFQDIDLLTNHFGYDQVKISSNKYQGNNERINASVKKWSDGFPVTIFYADCKKLLEKISSEEFYPNDLVLPKEHQGEDETVAAYYSENDLELAEEDFNAYDEALDKEIQAKNYQDSLNRQENNEKVKPLFEALFQKHKLKTDKNFPPENFRRFVFESPEIIAKFGESAPYILSKLRESESSSYFNYFLNSGPSAPFKQQFLKVESKTGKTISRNFNDNETDFQIIYETDSILLSATNENQGSDQIKIPAPKNCYDIYSLPVLIAHSAIDKDFHMNVALFDLITTTTVIYTYSESVEINMEDDSNEIEEIVAKKNRGVNASPEFFLAEISYVDEGLTKNTNEAYYSLKIKLTGNTRGTHLSTYTSNSEEPDSFFIQVKKSFPHQVLSIYNQNNSKK